MQDSGTVLVGIPAVLYTSGGVVLGIFARVGREFCGDGCSMAMLDILILLLLNFLCTLFTHEEFDCALPQSGRERHFYAFWDSRVAQPHTGDSSPLRGHE